MKFTLVIFAFLSNIAAIVFGFLNATNIGGLFHNNIANLSAKYHNEITPDAFVFMIIWPIIYLWIFAANIYLIASLWLPANQSPVNFIPTLTPTKFLISCIVGPLTSVVWLFSFDRELVKVSFVVLLIGVAALWNAVKVSLTVVYDNLARLEAQSKEMLLIIRILIHNGLCLFATWSTIATVISFANALIYVNSSGSATAKSTNFVNEEDGSSIALGILLLFILGMFILENFTKEKYFRYVFTIFPVFVFALSGLVVKLSASDAKRNLIIAGVELGVSIVCLITRIVLSIFRLSSGNRDYYPTKKSAKIDLLDDYQ